MSLTLSRITRGGGTACAHLRHAWQSKKKIATCTATQMGICSVPHLHELSEARNVFSAVQRWIGLKYSAGKESFESSRRPNSRVGFCQTDIWKANTCVHREAVVGEWGLSRRGGGCVLYEVGLWANSPPSLQPSASPSRNTLLDTLTDAHRIIGGREIDSLVAERKKSSWVHTHYGADICTGITTALQTALRKQNVNARLCMPAVEKMEVPISAHTSATFYPQFVILLRIRILYSSLSKTAPASRPHNGQNGRVSINY
jgi:hypothetical protein